MSILGLIRPRYVNDGAGPSAPGTPVLAGAATTSGFSVTWPPASDISGVEGYRVYLAQDPATPVRVGSGNIDTVACAWTFAALAQGTAYRVQVEAIDIYGNVSSKSSIATISTASAGSVSLYRNPNNESFAYLQGNTSPNGVEGSATTRAECGFYDGIITQWKWPAAQAAESTWVSQLRSAHPHLKIMMYTDDRYWYTSDESGPGGTGRPVYLAGAANGAPDAWRARNAAGTQMAHVWSPSNTRAINWCNAVIGTNANGKTLTDALFDEYEAYFQWSLYDGTMFDDINIIPSNFTIPGDGGSDNWDYNRDGVNDSYLSDETFKAAWVNGIKAKLDRFRQRYPTKLVNNNTDPTYWYRQTQATGRPPAPFSSHPFYEMDDVSCCEGLFSFAGGWFTMGEATDQVYPILSFFSISSTFMAFEFYRQISRPASTNLMGRRIGFAHNQLRINDTDAPSQTTIAMARAHWGCARLCDGGYGTVRSGSRPFPIDEMCLALGDRISTTSMGTLNEGGSTTTFTMRAADLVTSGASFYFAEYENALVVVRLDTVGLSIPGSNFGDGSSITYTLPSAGSGKKWQRPNCATYVHPTIATLAMQNQSPSLNNGADATTSSLKPLHCEVFLRVNT